MYRLPDINNTKVADDGLPHPPSDASNPF